MIGQAWHGVDRNRGGRFAGVWLLRHRRFAEGIDFAREVGAAGDGEGSLGSPRDFRRDRSGRTGQRDGVIDVMQSAMSRDLNLYIHQPRTGHRHHEILIELTRERREIYQNPPDDP